MKDVFERIKIGNVLTIAGRCGMGKTVVGMNIAKSLAETEKVLYVSADGSVPIDPSYLKFDFINTSKISDIMCAIINNKYDVVIIDSFQYMQKHEIEDTAYMLKTIAEELEVAIIVFSHITRKCQKRKDKRPKYSDIKDKNMCGYLYKYSDNIVFLYRDSYYHSKKEDALEFIEYDKGFFRKRHTIERIPFESLLEKGTI